MMYNVLLVDDEPIVKIALRTMIDWESLGFSICGTAADGVEALQLVNEHHPHIIITDLKMPNMDGLELIRALNEQGYNGKILVASNFGEYELVREALLLGAVDYLLKISIQTDSLVEQLNKIVKLIEAEKQTEQEETSKEHSFKSHLQKVKSTLLKEYFTVAEYELTYLTQNKLISYTFNEKPCCLFYLALHSAKQSNNHAQSNISLSFIENMILNVLELETDIEIFQVHKNAIIILVSEARLHKYSFTPETFSERIKALIQLYMTIDPIIVYSHEVVGYGALRQMFERAKETSHYYFYEQKQVMKVDESPFSQKIDFTNFITLSRLMLDYLFDKNKTKLMENMHDYISQCKQHKIHPTSLRAVIIKSIESMPLMEEKLHIENSAQFEQLMSNIEQSSTSELLIRYTFEILDEFKLNTLNSNDIDLNGVKKEIAQVVAYINENYKNKITLEQIAEHVNFSESYLCKVFRDQIGVSLMSYINTVRLNKAAELILQDNIYIKEVANLVGINDQFYFSRLFKRHFGVAPTEYNQQVVKARHEGHTG